MEQQKQCGNSVSISTVKETAHDGFRSRKVISLWVGAGFLLVAGAAALFLSPFLAKPICTFDQWATFNNWLLPTTYVIYCGANVLEKKNAKKG